MHVMTLSFSQEENNILEIPTFLKLTSLVFHFGFLFSIPNSAKKESERGK